MSLLPPPPELTVGRQGHYAGGVSRLVALGLDIAAIWLLYTLAAAAVSLASQLIVGHPVTLGHYQWLAFGLLVGWGFVYFAYQWSLSGKTLGMALFGLQVVRVDGGPASPRQAVLRTLVLPFSFLLLGIGLFTALVQRERRALHDLAAGTVVVYAWDARAARLRWLARKEPAPRR